jgi:hypothetical protein
MSENILEPSVIVIPSDEEAVEVTTNSEGSEATEEIVVQLPEDIADDVTA